MSAAPKQAETFGLHLPNAGALQKLTRIQRWRVSFWSHLIDWVEARWLAANGWTEVGGGLWRLPDWHPKRQQTQRRHNRDRHHFADRLVYDQNHAANSQRHYIWAVQSRIEPLRKYPAFPTYERAKRVGLLAMVASLVTFVAAAYYWSPTLFLLGGVIGFGQWLYTVLTVRRGLELEYTEERLGGARALHHSD